MKGLLSAGKSITPEALFSDTSYMNAPTEMTMKMHMIGSMFGVSDQLTVMAMIPYLSNSMRSQAKMGGAISSMESEGLGDVSATAMWSLSALPECRSHLSLGVSLPTGKIDVKKGSMILGYPMQLGSGSYELRPGYTITCFSPNYSYGAQVSSKLRFADNDQGYRLGNEVGVKAWGAYQVMPSLSVSSTVSWMFQEAISGTHKGIMNAAMSPAMDTQNSGGSRVLASLGANYVMMDGLLSGYRLAFECLVPVQSSLTGVQMSQSSTVVLGVQKAY